MYPEAFLRPRESANQKIAAQAGKQKCYGCQGNRERIELTDDKQCSDNEAGRDTEFQLPPMKSTDTFESLGAIDDPSAAERPERVVNRAAIPGPGKMTLRNPIE